MYPYEAFSDLIVAKHRRGELFYWMHEQVKDSFILFFVIMFNFGFTIQTSIPSFAFLNHFFDKYMNFLFFNIY